ncbi:MAG: DUF6715 family protein [Mobilitalea sp.]
MGKTKTKAKYRTLATVLIMSLLALIIIAIYLYFSNRTEPLEEPSVENMSEIELLLDKDLDLYYPESPREVTKLFSRMMKAIYDTDTEQDQLEVIAMKIRNLYDEEFLTNNPEDTYLTNLYTDIAIWKEADRRITNFIVADEETNQISEIDGVKYAIVSVSFTIQENGKFVEKWEVMLRQGNDKKWKILGWKTVSEDK